MTHWIILPIVVPLLAGALLVLADRFLPRVVTVLGAISIAVQLCTVIVLGARTADGEVLTYLLGNWPTPFGIALAADRLTVIMLALTVTVALAAFIAARDGVDRRGAHFHALLQFQLAGLNGAFLTADLFNLFVFFEVLLIASYALLLHEGREQRLRSGVHYVIANLLASTIFLIAVGLLYSVAGSLNLADLSERLAALPPDAASTARMAALLLLVVFAMKAAVLPLHFWLPGAYRAAAMPVAALFVIMTKVGVYCIARVFTVLFASQPGSAAEAIGTVLLPIALVTLAFSAIGMIGASSVRGIAAYAVISSAGTLLAPLAVQGSPAVGAALFYLVHSTLAVAALFLIASLIARQSGPRGDELTVGPALPKALGVLFMLVALAVAGLPPLAGFIGKALILAGTEQHPAIWIVLLSASLLMVVAFARAGSLLFWKPAEHAAANPFGDTGTDPDVSSSARGTRAATLLLTACLIVLVPAAGALQRYTLAAAEQILHPAGYIEAVLGTPPVQRSDRAAHDALPEPS